MPFHSGVALDVLKATCRGGRQVPLQRRCRLRSYMLTVSDTGRRTQLEHGRTRPLCPRRRDRPACWSREPLCRWTAGSCETMAGPCPSIPSELQIFTEQRTSSLGIHGAGFAKVARDGTFSMRSGAGTMQLRRRRAAAAMVREIGAAGWYRRHGCVVRSDARPAATRHHADRSRQPAFGDRDRSLGASGVERARGHLSRGPRAMDQPAFRPHNVLAPAGRLRDRCASDLHLSRRRCDVTAAQRVDGSRGPRASLAVGIHRCPSTSSGRKRCT